MLPSIGILCKVLLIRNLDGRIPLWKIQIRFAIKLESLQCKVNWRRIPLGRSGFSSFVIDVFHWPGRFQCSFSATDLIQLFYIIQFISLTDFWNLWVGWRVPLARAVPEQFQCSTRWRHWITWPVENDRSSSNWTAVDQPMRAIPASGFRLPASGL